MTDWELILALVSTIRHDGNGGVADDLATLEGLDSWLAATPGLVGPAVPEEFDRVRVTELRRAVRSLFARAVAPNPPSKADAHRLLDLESSLAVVNAAAGGLGAPGLAWPEGRTAQLRFPDASADPSDYLLAQLAGAAIGFLTSADVSRLRACPAPRCVRYFRQDDPRQAWCKPSCGNRARVARHYQRNHGSVE